MRSSYCALRCPYPLTLPYPPPPQQEKDTVTECTLATLEGQGLSDFAFASQGVLNHTMISSPALREALLELDYGGATHAELRLAAEAPHFRFRSPAPMSLGILSVTPDDGHAAAAAATPPPPPSVGSWPVRQQSTARSSAQAHGPGASPVAGSPGERLELVDGARRGRGACPPTVLSSDAAGSVAGSSSTSFPTPPPLLPPPFFL